MSFIVFKYLKQLNKNKSQNIQSEQYAPRLCIHPTLLLSWCCSEWVCKLEICDHQKLIASSPYGRPLTLQNVKHIEKNKQKRVKRSLIWQQPTNWVNNGNTTAVNTFFLSFFLIFRQSTKCTQSHKVNQMYWIPQWSRFRKTDYWFMTFQHNSFLEDFILRHTYLGLTFTEQ